jgi:LysM repeat protein
MVHLTHSGYLLKGQLMAESYERTAYWLKHNDTGKYLVYNVDSLRAPLLDTTPKTQSATQTQIRYQWLYHRVLRGQTIWSVAAAYGVSAYQIKSWNRLRSNYLWIGQILKIYAPIKVQVPIKPVNPIVTKPIDSTEITGPDTTRKVIPKPVVQRPPAPKPQTRPPLPPPTPKALYHKVRSGETLFSISKKYGSSTSAIMKLNHMKSHNLRAGQTIRVK